MCRTSTQMPTSPKRSLIPTQGNKAQRRSFVMGNAPGQNITLGIDPGTAIVGYAVVTARGDDLDMIVCNVFNTPAGIPLTQRLKHIYHCLSKVTTIYKLNETS